MATWTERMHRSAVTISDVVTSCGQPSVRPIHSRRIEKVKFGAPLQEVCKNDIPGPLLILILKINKEGPNKRDVFRAPGNQGNMKKLIYFLQTGRLINIDNFSVYTIASVLKKFLQKIPNGIFGREVELELFSVIESEDTQYQRDQIHQLITSMPVINQHLLVLLLGTFRVIALNSKRAQTGMTSEAIGVSVAPSFFQLCVADGKNACMEDVMRFKVATRIMKFMIDNFGVSNLLGRENYEYYAKITGRILKVEEDWIFAFRYPPDCLLSHSSLTIPVYEETQSTPALVHVPECLKEFSANRVGKEELKEPDDEELENMEDLAFKSDFDENDQDSCGRLSISLEENRLYKVHERQKQRMESRSQWFLSPWHKSASLSPPNYECKLSPLYFIHSSESLDEEDLNERT
ncbi:UNVERIFIED_CONTAM: hypothetical protein RMT77_009954 [Armadillidium vulgare]